MEYQKPRQHLLHAKGMMVQIHAAVRGGIQCKAHVTSPRLQTAPYPVSHSLQCSGNRHTQHSVCMQCWLPLPP